MNPIKPHFVAILRVLLLGIGWIVVIGTYPVWKFLKIRFLPVKIERIGHLCIEPDCFIKEGILKLRPRYRAIILAATTRAANNDLVQYWKQYFKIIQSPLLCALLWPIASQRLIQYSVAQYCTAINSTATCFSIQHLYASRPTLLKLNKNDTERGWQWLEQYGISRGDWYVCLHVREEGYAPNEGQTYRNANIASYVLAIRTIVARGGWVIRMGDSSMQKLPEIKHVIDYASNNTVHDWRDVFLTASCKFFIGSASGLCCIPQIFGVPVVSINNAPMSVVYSYGLGDLAIPKLMWEKQYSRLLTFSEVLDSKIGDYRFDHLFEMMNVKVIDNTEEEICDVIIEMIEKLESTVLYTVDDERLQLRFRSYFKQGHYSYGAISRIGRDFLRKYQALFVD